MKWIFEMGVDFGINTYDEDFAVMVLQKNLTSKIDELVKDAETFGYFKFLGVFDS